MKQESMGLKEYRSLKKGTKRRKSEESLQLAVCNYLKTCYPGIIFFCDMSSGMKMPIWMAARNKKMKSSRGLPDLFVVEPKFAVENIFGSNFVCKHLGLFIELKKEGTRLRTKDGYYANEHIEEQAVVLERLSKLGYKAEFACGFDEAVKLIDNYMK